MSYNDKQCIGCVGITHDCILPIILKHGEIVFNCPCINCMVKIICQESCDQYKRYLDLARFELNKNCPEEMIFIDTAFIDTAVINNGDGYRDFLSHFRLLDEEKKHE